MKTKLERKVEKAIGAKRKERLLKHLERLEEKMDAKCRTTRYGVLDGCPINNFAPGIGRFMGRTIWFNGSNSIGVYLRRTRKRNPLLSPIEFKLYTNKDQKWWCNLPYDTKRLVTLWLEEYFKAREKH